MGTRATIHSLDDDALGVLIGYFPPKLRVSTVSLVSKTWLRVERKHPYRPIDLDLRPQDFTAAFLTWHCRDTSRLKAVRVSGGTWQDLESASYHEGVPRLLRHLQAWAPSLRTLELVPASPAGESMSPGILPLVGALSQLERLALRQWYYTKSDIADFYYLASLQNLKALELSGLRLSERNRSDSETDDLYEGVSGAFQLEDLVLCLQLTSLDLRRVDFLSYDFISLPLPKEDIGCLKKLRSLTYRNADLPWDTEFPHIAQLSKLTRLELASNFGGGSLSDMLSGLTDLKDLTLSSEGSLEPLVLPSAAEVTKLTVAGSLAKNMPIGAALPVETLRNVRCLSIKCLTGKAEDLDLSAAWAELTNLTQLDLQVVDTTFWLHHFPPKFPLEAVGLRVIELTTGYEAFDKGGEAYVKLLTSNLPLLAQLKLDVKGIPEANRARFDQICTSLSLRLPEWVHSIEKASAAGNKLTCIVNFNLAGEM